MFITFIPRCCVNRRWSTEGKCLGTPRNVQICSIPRPRRSQNLFCGRDSKNTQSSAAILPAVHGVLFWCPELCHNLWSGAAAAERHGVDSRLSTHAQELLDKTQVTHSWTKGRRRVLVQIEGSWQPKTPIATNNTNDKTTNKENYEQLFCVLGET